MLLTLKSSINMYMVCICIVLSKRRVSFNILLAETSINHHGYSPVENPQSISQTTKYDKCRQKFQLRPPPSEVIFYIIQELVLINNKVCHFKLGIYIISPKPPFRYTKKLLNLYSKVSNKLIQFLLTLFSAEF